MDSYRLSPLSYSVAVTRGGETKRVSCCVAKNVFMLCSHNVYEAALPVAVVAVAMAIEKGDGAESAFCRTGFHCRPALLRCLLRFSGAGVELSEICIAQCWLVSCAVLRLSSC